METLMIEVAGKMAHFRKFFANNTAFSYAVPPRTTLMGMMAALCGIPKDEYYEAFASENLRLGVGLVAPTKKRFHRMSYLQVERPDDFRGGKQHIQTPIELVTGLDLRSDEVHYRIFVAAGQEAEPYETIKAKIREQSRVYPLVLGAAFCTASLLSYTVNEAHEQQWEGQGDFMPFHSALQAETVEQLKLENESDGSMCQVEEEQMPIDFVADRDREVRQMRKALFATDGQPLRAHLRPNSAFFTADNLHFQFLE